MLYLLEKLAKDLADYQAKVNAKAVQSSVGQNANFEPGFAMEESLPNIKQPEQGDSAKFFKSKEENPFGENANKPAMAVAASSVEDLPADDDLPF